ncbi:hypothetical protein [Mucilaginibacter gilvus]|uniref:Uncharacterized protein n=1 Tax=Mucilaginibacter gilvus TaxID=2305909 RepID=A0A444MKC1_9SPHI|nr:hypothetical protein [Mucilaginibacter gilvus]RWY49286.1 hypothetical protein EPL05_17910 [Mucilaginibacter gilvus]
MKNSFAAQQPVQLISKSPRVAVHKFTNVADLALNNNNTSADYMDPEYNITINKAYGDFDYSFSVYVDKEGKMYYGEPLTAFPEGTYRDNYILKSTAVMNSYIKQYLCNIPGETLGMKHASLISLHVKGVAGAGNSLALR